jgi:hypothetical protein
LKEYKTENKNFLKTAELSFKKGFDRFGVSALEYTLDCYKAAGDEEKVKELKTKIKEAKEKLSVF